MKVIYVIFRVVLKVIYAILKLIPIKANKIVFISRQSNRPSLDFKLLEQELKNEYPEVSCVFLTKQVELKALTLIAYFPHIVRQMYHLATSVCCIVDSYIIPVSLLTHKKELLIIQIWHAAACIKKFGYQTLDKEGGRSRTMAEALAMHKNYDYIISGCEQWREAFSEAFNAPLEKIVALGMPKIDFIKDQQDNIRERFYLKYPELKDKKIIVYVPTFRRWEFNGSIALNESFKNQDFVFITKPHPLDTNYARTDRSMYNDFSSFEMLTVADYVISDYSAISMEAISIDKPVLFYVPDYQRYLAENGLNIDLFEMMPNNTYTDSDQLVKAITENTFDQEQYESFKAKFGQAHNHATKDICAIALKHLVH